MSKVKLARELLFTAADEVGTLAKISKATAAAGVNIQAIKAYTKEGQGHFMLVADDAAKAAATLKDGGIEVEEREVVLLELEHKIGARAETSEKLAAAGINITHIYASAGEAASSCIVFTCNDNAKAVEVLS